MTYRDHYRATDELVSHLATLIPTLYEPLKARYVGFISVSIATAFELAAKDIFIDFASRKHKVFGEYIESKYKHLNGKITVGDLSDKAKEFGTKYKKRFVKSKEKLKKECPSIESDYNNLIECRHKFVHEGVTTLTFDEVSKNYEAGKKIMEILAAAMTR